MAGREISPAVIRHEINLADKLAPQANEYHRLAMQSCKATLEHAVNGGKVLLQMKEVIKHGEWERYVDERLDMAVSTAQKYMRLASKYDEMWEDLGPGQMSEMSIRGGLAHLESKNKAMREATRIEGKESRAADLSDQSPISDECPKGGSHVWENDEELDEEVCAKCHDPRAAHRSSGEAGDTAGSQGAADSGLDGGKRQAESGDRASAGSDSAIPQKIDQLFGEIIRLVDQAGKRDKTEEFKHALNIAYLEFRAWKK